MGECAAFDDLGRVVTLIAADEAALLAYARSITYWHRRHRFCGACGSPTIMRQAGHARVCIDRTCEAQQFPRTDPVDHAGYSVCGGGEPVPAGSAAALDARSRIGFGRLCRAGRDLGGCCASRGAGGVRPGARYPPLHGITTMAISVLLMLGFQAKARNGSELRVDSDELEEARWFCRDEVAAIARSACGCRSVARLRAR